MFWWLFAIRPSPTTMLSWGNFYHLKNVLLTNLVSFSLLHSPAAWHYTSYTCDISYCSQHGGWWWPGAYLVSGHHQPLCWLLTCGICKNWIISPAQWSCWGYIGFTPSVRLYVRPACRGRSVAQQLFDRVTLYRLVSNIRRTSNIRHTPTLGNSQLEFLRPSVWPKPPIQDAPRVLTFWVSIVDKVQSRPTWSELLQVAWDFDSLWIKGPMTPYQSQPYARHIAVIPAAKLCDSIAIVFLSIEVRIRHHLRRYIDGSAILFWLSRDPYDPDDQRFHHASWRKLCGIKQHFDKITSVCDKLSISNYIFQA